MSDGHKLDGKHYYTGTTTTTGTAANGRLERALIAGAAVVDVVVDHRTKTAAAAGGATATVLVVITSTTKDLKRIERRDWQVSGGGGGGSNSDITTQMPIGGKGRHSKDVSAVTKRKRKHCIRIKKPESKSATLSPGDDPRWGKRRREKGGKVVAVYILLLFSVHSSILPSWSSVRDVPNAVTD